MQITKYYLNILTINLKFIYFCSGKYILGS